MNAITTALELTTSIAEFNYRGKDRTHGLSARLESLEKTGHRLVEIINEGAPQPPALPEKIDLGNLETVAEDYARDLVLVSDYATVDRYKTVQSGDGAAIPRAWYAIGLKLAGQIDDELAANVPVLVSNIAEQLAEAAEEYTAAVAQIPAGADIDNVQPKVLERAQDAARRLRLIASMRQILARFPSWSDVVTDTFGFGGARVTAPYELTLPETPEQYLLLRNAAANPSAFNELETALNPVWFHAARNGVPFAFVSPAEAHQSAMKLSVRWVAENAEAVASSTAFERFAGIDV